MTALPAAALRVGAEAPFLAFLGALLCERLVELRLSRANAQKAFARGGREAGQRHFGAMTFVHALWFLAMGLELVLRAPPFPRPWGWVALGGALLAQALRWWAIATLGERWNVRVIVVPGALPVRAGPYRFLRHPNYLAVIVELACVPLVHGLWVTAVAFTLANAWLLRVRIRAEEEALGALYQDAFAGTPRLVPGAGR